MVITKKGRFPGVQSWWKERKPEEPDYLADHDSSKSSYLLFSWHTKVFFTSVTLSSINIIITGPCPGLVNTTPYKKRTIIGIIVMIFNTLSVRKGTKTLLGQSYVFKIGTSKQSNGSISRSCGLSHVSSVGISVWKLCYICCTGKASTQSASSCVAAAHH